MTTIDDFHHHLDRCPRCRENPFDLCADGEEILLRVVLSGSLEVRDLQTAPSMRAKLGVDGRLGAVEDAETT
jgi:hypothetical protein